MVWTAQWFEEQAPVTVVGPSYLGDAPLALAEALMLWIERENKRGWWRKHGNAWREARKGVPKYMKGVRHGKNIISG